MKEMLEEGKASDGSLPVNVAFVFEGEEENGSAGFEDAVRGNLHWFEGTQLIVISNTLWVGERVPCLTYGMRGMIALSIEVKGPTRDLHSGNEGGESPRLYTLMCLLDCPHWDSCSPLDRCLCEMSKTAAHCAWRADACHE